MKTNNTTILLASAGALAGLYMAYKGDKKFWGYVGYFVLGSVAGHLAGNIVNVVIPQPKDNTTTTITTKGGETTTTTKE